MENSHLNTRRIKNMKKYLTSFTLVALAALSAFARELPEPPEGFIWAANIETIRGEIWNVKWAIGETYRAEDIADQKARSSDEQTQQEGVDERGDAIHRRIKLENELEKLNKKLEKELLDSANLEVKVPESANPVEAESPFLDPGLFQISVTSKEERWTHYSHSHDRKEIRYFIRFRNMSTVSFIGLRAESCTYHDINDREGTQKYVESKFNYGSLGNRHEFSLQHNQSKKFSLFEYSSRSNDPFLSKMVKGICVRVYLPLANGQEAVREYRFPENELPEKTYVWGVDAELPTK